MKLGDIAEIKNLESYLKKETLSENDIIIKRVKEVEFLTPDEYNGKKRNPGHYFVLTHINHEKVKDLFSLLNTPETKEKLNNQMSGTALKTINIKTLNSFEI